MANFLTSGALLDRHSVRIQEMISKSMMVFAYDIDPLWAETVVTSQGVGPMGNIGRDLRILKTYMGGLTGVIDGGRVRNDFSMAGDATTALGTKAYLQQALQTFPDPTEGPNQRPYDLAIPMRSNTANIMFTLGESQLDNNPNTIGSVLAPKMAGFARNMGRKLCSSWYVKSDTSYSLSTITNISAITDNGDGTYQFTFNPGNLATQRYAPGMRVDVYVASGGVGLERANDTEGAPADQTPQTRINTIVGAVDGYTNTVTIVTAGDPAGDWQVPPADTYVVTYANEGHHVTGDPTASFVNFAGFFDWCKNTGNLLGSQADPAKAIDVSVHPEFKSFFKDEATGPLGEDMLSQRLQRWHAVNDPLGHDLDTLTATTGVWHSYWKGLVTNFQVERDRRISTLMHEGVEGDYRGRFRITADGREYIGTSTEWLESGELIGYKRVGNWSRFVPPKPNMVTPFGEAPSYVPFQFVGEALSGSPRLPVLRKDGAGMHTLITEGYQMPGDLRLQLVPEQTAAMYLYNLEDARVYSD